MSLIEQINLLIVEDNNDKLQSIKHDLELFEKSHDEIEFCIKEARNYNEYSKAYEDFHFDFIILDLSIPIAGNDKANFIVSSSILSSIKTDCHKRPFTIIGLTSYSPEEYGDLFDENHMFKIFNYREKEWLNYLKDVVGFIHSGKVSLKYHFDNSYNTDILIITARKNNEFDPVVKHMPWIRNTYEEDPILNKQNKYNALGRIIDKNNNEVTVKVVCLGEMGLSSSAALTSRLICDYRPRMLAMLGMCCGFNDSKQPYQTNIGDVILAKETACWDEGKYFDMNEESDAVSTFYFSPKNRRLEKSSIDSIDAYLEVNWEAIQKNISNFYSRFEGIDKVNSELEDGVEISSNFHFDLMLSGSAVIDNQSKVTEIRARYPLAKGLDMEAHSVYTAVELISGAIPKVAVIKGVADYGDGNKHKAAQKAASAASLVVFLDIFPVLLQSH